MSDRERPGASRDSAYMRRALALARRGWGQTAPNPMVGAVVVRDGTIVGEGFHARYGGDHAEVAALGAAGERARGATMYVTLEPCAHFGKTPPCAEALIAAGVRRVVAAIADPSPVARGGAERLRAAGIEVDLGIEAQPARELNAAFFHAHSSDLPWVVLKLAMSVDGAIADPSGRIRWLTGPQARREVHRLRANSDAIAVGIGTALCDDPRLTVRGVRPPRVPPRRVIFDRDARLPVDSYLVRTARVAPTVVVTRDARVERARALREAGVTVLAAESLEDALRTLRALDVRALLVEGGARLSAALLERPLAHRLVIFQAPVLLGAGALHALAHATPSVACDGRRLRVLRRATFGDDLMTVFALTAA